jgi:hypothetical protein
VFDNKVQMPLVVPEQLCFVFSAWEQSVDAAGRSRTITLFCVAVFENKEKMVLVIQNTNSVLCLAFENKEKMLLVIPEQ